MDLKTVNIKGKEYVEVNERIKYFRANEAYKGWALQTEIIELTQDRCVMKAIIRNADGVVMAEGCAYETAGSSFINKTSYIENCETSAWGRALGNLGIGVDSSVASANEVLNAINNQTTKKSEPSTKKYTQEGRPDRYSKEKANASYSNHSISPETMTRIRNLSRDGKTGGDVLKSYLESFNKTNGTSYVAADLKTDAIVNKLIDFIDNTPPSDF